MKKRIHSIGPTGYEMKPKKLPENVIIKFSNQFPPIKISSQTKIIFFLSFVMTLTKEKTLAHLEIPIFHFFNPT